MLNLPLFYLEGVVLFPEATLPLRVTKPNFIAAVNRAMSQADAPYTIGVVHAYRNTNSGLLNLAKIGTTAEIRQNRPLEDGRVNLVTRGQQRFCLRRHWIDAGASFGEIQIIEKDVPFITPRDACAKLVPLSLNDSSSPPYSYEKQIRNAGPGIGAKSMARKLAGPRSRISCGAFWPYWVYRVYDSYFLAQRAADMWKQIVGMPDMDGFVTKPDLLSFYIASKIPVYEPTRQELLEIDGISCRLRREIELLERLDCIRCDD